MLARSLSIYMLRSMSNVGYAILGAILAGATQLLVGVAIEAFKGRRRIREERRNYALVVRLELEATVKQLDKLKVAVHERGFYPFAVLNCLIVMLADCSLTLRRFLSPAKMLLHKLSL